MKTEQVPRSLHYSRDAGWFGGLIVMVAQPPICSIVTCTLNSDGDSEIGEYEVVLSEEDYSDAVTSVRRSRYDEIPQSYEPFAPDSGSMAIGVTNAGDDLPTMHAFPLSTLPAAVAELSDELERGVILKIRQHRTSVVSGRGSWQTPASRANELLAINVDLTSVGTSPVRIANPLEPGSGASLRLSLRREDGTGVQSTDVEPSHLRPPRPAPPGQELYLSPGANLSFSIAKRAYLEPGRYEGHLLYRSPRGALNDRGFVSGHLSMPLGIMTITP